MRLLVRCLALSVWPAVAFAQQPSSRTAPPPKPSAPVSLYSNASADNQPDSRFGVTFTLTRPVPADDPTQAIKAEQAIRHALLALVDKECAALEGAIASKCELQSLNVNVNMGSNVFPRFGYAAQPEVKAVSASANAVFNVALRIDAH